MEKDVYVKIGERLRKQRRNMQQSFLEYQPPFMGRLSVETAN